MDSTLTVVNIYGPIADKTEIIVGVGNYNNVHGLLTYLSGDDLLQMTPLTDVITPTVLPLILTYEHIKDNRLYFSLASNNNYINVEMIDDKVVACLSDTKGIFWIDYSSIDTKPRSELLAGALYSLCTTFNNKEHVVSWKIKGFANGDLIIFLPTTWYETENNTCAIKTGSFNLVENLYKLSFKGYTTQEWCKDSPNIVHCPSEQLCGECLGPCSNNNYTCYPDGKGKFKCQTSSDPLVTFTDNTNTSTNMIAVWIALIAIVLVVALLTWSKSNNW